METIKVVVSGAGAAGIATVNLLALYGVRHIITFDSKGPIYDGRQGLNSFKEDITDLNIDMYRGDLSGALVDADVFIGVSQPNIVTADDISKMADKPIVFALSNPNPEITPEEAYQGGAYIVATGRSDHPNQVNNVLAFPGIFRGALDAGIRQITDEHKIAAAQAIAGYVTEPRPDMIIPSALDKNIAYIVAEAVKSVG